MTDIYTSSADALEVSISRERDLTVTTYVSAPPHRSAGNAKDIHEFLSLVAAAYEDWEQRNSRPVASWVPIKYIRPKEHAEGPDANSDVILFTLISRDRRNMTPDGQRKPRGPASRQQIEDPDDPTNLITISGQFRDNIVEFKVLSIHSKNANRLAVDFERFMEAYTWYFTEQGVNRVWYDSRQKDEILEIGASEYSVRPIRYLIQTELLYKEIDKKLTKILVDFDIGSQLNTTVIDEETGLKEHSIDHGSA